MEDKDSGVVSESGRLVVKRDLGFGHGLKLEGVLTPVLSTGEKQVTVDLSEVRHLCSSNLAVLAAACNTIVRKGKKVRIVAVPSVARILRLGGMERIASVEEVGGE